ncbi:fructose-bisphosphate aldolase 1, cytoplasmic-like protein [Tanacetum coccineum]
MDGSGTSNQEPEENGYSNNAINVVQQFLSVLWSGPLIIFARLILDQQAHSTTLKTWVSRVGDVMAAQPKFLARFKASSEAIYGTYGGVGVLNSESLYVKECKY